MAVTDLVLVATERGVMRVIGELDMSTVEAFERELRAVEGPLTLDLSELAFIDSSGLNALSRCAAARNGDGPLTLVNVSAFTRRVLEIVGLDRMPTIQIR